MDLEALPPEPPVPDEPAADAERAAAARHRRLAGRFVFGGIGLAALAGAYVLGASTHHGSTVQVAGTASAVQPAADGSSTACAKPTPKLRRGIVGQVSGISPAGFTVTGPGGKAVTVTTSASTSFHRERRDGKVADAAVGDRVAIGGPATGNTVAAAQIVVLPAASASPAPGAPPLGRPFLARRLTLGTVASNDGHTLTVTTSTGTVTVTTTPATTVVEDTDATKGDVAQGAYVTVAGTPTASGLDATSVTILPGPPGFRRGGPGAIFPDGPPGPVPPAPAAPPPGSGAGLT